jgi:two-component system sensor histidine kinase GlrK
VSGFRLFPRSLRQLVLLAFLLVILPLLFLATQAYRSLDNLSSEAANINQTTLDDAQRSENMTNLALSMERSYRQYCVLKDEEIGKLYQGQHAKYSSMLKEHADAVENDSLYQSLELLLNAIHELKCDEDQPEQDIVSSLQQFSSENNLMLQATRDIVFSRGKQLQESIAEQGNFFGQWALIVFILSIGLVLLFTHMIIGPVKTVNRMITLLGEGKFIEENVSLNGPLELKELAQRIIWLSDRLSWLEAQRHQFLRHISHELKTPLASMREGTELLADQVVGELTKDQKDVVAILDESSRHLQKLIEQLLDYNRKLADLPDEKQEIDLISMMDDVISVHSLSAKSKAMVTECNLEVTHYWGEEKLLIRIIDNLYSNAVHYGEESGMIWISSKKINDYIQIDIANTGYEIPEKDRPMLFEPFYQGSHQRKGAVKGSGLGLSIARDCIYRMKGELQLVNVDYANVCFRIKLPLRKES